MRALVALALGVLGALVAAGVLVAAPPAPAPALVRDVKTGVDNLGSQVPAAPDPIQDYVQPETQIEPSIAVNPANPKNVVAVYQEARIADGGDATNGYATSTDGGKTWSDPVIFQDDNLGGLNDKNWIVVDNSDAPGHHKGRVYVVWDRVAPVVYDYCDHDCDQLSNWLPDLQTLDPVVEIGRAHV